MDNWAYRLMNQTEFISCLSQLDLVLWLTYPPTRPAPKKNQKSSFIPSARYMGVLWSMQIRLLLLIVFVLISSLAIAQAYLHFSNSSSPEVLYLQQLWCWYLECVAYPKQGFDRWVCYLTFDFTHIAPVHSAKQGQFFLAYSKFLPSRLDIRA